MEESSVDVHHISFIFPQGQGVVIEQILNTPIHESMGKEQVAENETHASENGSNSREWYFGWDNFADEGIGPDLQITT